MTNTYVVYKPHVVEREFLLFDAEQAKAFNLLVKHLVGVQHLDKGDTYELLSSLHLPKKTIQSWLRYWHSNGLITLHRDKVRLGNVMLAHDNLDEQTKVLLKAI
jgi:hypothetical protein